MRVWRLCKAKHAGTPLSGEGARLHGGRWNHVGTPMVYTSASLSLAILESLVHLEAGDLPPDYVSIAFDLPDDLPKTTLSPQDLPVGWDLIPGPKTLKDLGTAWAQAGREAILLVPTAITPDEWNVLLNPLHPEMARVTAHPPAPFAFDPRLLP